MDFLDLIDSLACIMCIRKEIEQREKLMSNQKPTDKIVRINTDSIFTNVDLEDADANRRMMVYLDYTLTNLILNDRPPKLKVMQYPERSQEILV
jgi:hypothetical protein